MVGNSSRVTHLFSVLKKAGSAHAGETCCHRFCTDTGVQKTWIEDAPKYCAYAIDGLHRFRKSCIAVAPVSFPELVNRSPVGWLWH